MYRYATRRRLRKMFQWYKNKQQPIIITSIYHNSMGDYNKWKYVGIIESFTVTQPVPDYGYYIVDITFTNGIKAHQEFDSEWEFTGLGKLRMCNSGPYCYFTIEFDRDTEESVIEFEIDTEELD